MDELKIIVVRMEKCKSNKSCLQSKAQLQQMENERLEQERKMEMIDAMNRFPTALKVCTLVSAGVILIF